MKLPQLEEFRQSTLRAMEVCPRRTMHALSVDPDTTTGWVGQSDDLGTMTHEVCWEIMRTLRRQGEPSMCNGHLPGGVRGESDRPVGAGA
jgi:hypothetical protein